MARRGGAGRRGDEYERQWRGIAAHAIYYAVDHPGTTVSFHIPVSDANFNGGVFTIRATDQLPRVGLGR